MKDRISTVALGLIGIALLAALWAPQAVVRNPEESEPAPNFTFRMNGREMQLADLRGQVVVLNMWASWCAPCIAEMPSLERLHRKMGGRGVLVLGINADEAQADYENFLRSFGLTFPNYHDPEHLVTSLYGTFMFPETFIVDRNGIMVRKVIGQWGWDDDETIAYLESLL